MAREVNLCNREQAILVWDLPTRLFHWLLVAAVSFAAVTGLFAPKWWVGRHIWAGYAVGALLIFRAVWAIYGSHHSRLRSFLYSPIHRARRSCICAPCCDDGPRIILATIPPAR